MSARRRAENRERREIAHATFGDAPLCAIPGCGRLADDVHEPLTRARGGSITDPSNMVPLCRDCHDVVQRGPQWAYDLGPMVHSWAGGEAACPPTAPTLPRFPPTRAASPCPPQPKRSAPSRCRCAPCWTTT